MKKIASFFALCSLFLLTACSGGHKKILILGHSDTKVNQEKKTVKLTKEDGHDEATIEYETKDVVTLKMSGGKEEKNISIPEDGCYVLNVKHDDTIVGCYQNYGEGARENVVLPPIIIKQKIDSLEQLIQGKNISVAARNYYILPFQSVKISSNAKATIISPFHQMSSLEVTQGEVPEVYRFYSVSEIRDIIDNMKEVIKPEKKK